MKYLQSLLALTIIFGVISCGDDDEPSAPAEENAEEVITDVVLTFTPQGGGATVTARAQDPDGDGPQDLQVLGDITLQSASNYELTLSLTNEENPIDIEDITAEIKEEAEEHMFFFSWTDGLFSDPTGNGNVDNRSDAVNYDDVDGDGLPLGLTTSWSTGPSASGSFRVILKHQPDGIKTATSGTSDGDTDIDISWQIVLR
ncbi:MAG: hypothetical protein RIC80_14470 [Cyclobacteriaceae bacterium]